MNAQNVYSIHSNYIIESVDESIILYDNELNLIHVIDNTGKFIMEQFNGMDSLNMIIIRMKNEYGESFSINDFSEFVDELIKKGILIQND